MFRKLITLAALCIALPVLAQPVAADSLSTAGANATLGSVSSSVQINNPAAPAVQGIDYRGSYTVKNVPSVNAPNLTSGFDSCMGSVSGSANGPGVGVSFGTTYSDEDCKRLKKSRELWNKGMKAASLAVDCMDADSKAALEMTGTKCPQSMTAEERKAAFGADASPVGAVPAAVAPGQAPVQVSGANTADPYIARRLGR